VLIAQSEFLQDFLRLGNRPVMDFTFLDKAFKAIRPQTWKRINEALAGYAKRRKGWIRERSGWTRRWWRRRSITRTDSALLMDSWRVLARLIREGRPLMPEGALIDFTTARQTRLPSIIRYGRSGAPSRKRLVKRCWRELIGHVRWIASIAKNSAQEPGLLGLDRAEHRRRASGFLRSVRVQSPQPSGRSEG